MAGKNLNSEECDSRPVSTTGMRSIAVLLTSLVAVPVFSNTALAQEAWRNLSVPKYSNATDYSVETDKDEYDIRFRSQDNVQAIFDFYRNYLQQQGFRVTDSKPTSHGFKADLVRGQGGPNDTIELDAKLKHGRYKVEIEFDE